MDKIEVSLHYLLAILLVLTPFCPHVENRTMMTLTIMISGLMLLIGKRV